MSSSFSVSMNSMLEVDCRFVMLSFPRLKSSIISWDFVSVKVSARSNSGFCFKLSLAIGGSGVMLTIGGSGVMLTIG